MPLDFPASPTVNQSYNGYVWSGVAWEAATPNAVSLTGQVIVADAAARDVLYPSPVQGNAVFRNDRGWAEQYYGLYNASTNPGGANPAGWYPVNGRLPKIVLQLTGGITIGTSLAVPTGTPTAIYNDGFAAPSGWVVTAPLDGLYKVTYSVTTGSGGSALVIGEIRRGSTTGTRYGFEVASQQSTSERNNLTMSALMPLSASQQTALWVRASVSLTAGEEHYLTVEYVAPKIIA